MRGLQTKQPPAVRFTYNPSPPRAIPTHSLTRHFSPPTPPAAYSSSPPAIRPGESSHIKVVDHDQIRSRRKKIFEEVGAAVRSSKSRERNRSFSIFNGARQNTTKIKELEMSKESHKEQSVQTNTISHFDQPTHPTPAPQPAPLKIQAPPAPAPVTRHKHHYIISSHPAEAERLHRELSLREKELAYLKLELERQQRCERLTHENESIYKRLVEKLDQIHSQSAIHSLQRTTKQRSKSKSPQRSPPSHNQSSSETTRFLHPDSAIRNSTHRREILPNALDQPQQNEPSPSHPSVVRPSTVTFCHKDKRFTKAHRATLHPPTPSDEELRERLEESVRRYTNTVNLEEVPLKDKLACMNRHLENKYTLREQTRPNSHSRYTQRGRSSSGPVVRAYLLL